MRHIVFSAPIKATEIISIWKDRGDPTVRFEYKMNSEQYTVVKILEKLFGASIS